MKKLVRLPEVLGQVPQCRTTIWRGVKNGTFPAPVSMGKNSIAWIQEEIDDWIAARVAERDGAAATLSEKEIDERNAAAVTRETEEDSEESAEDGEAGAEK